MSSFCEVENMRLIERGITNAALDILAFPLRPPGRRTKMFDPKCKELAEYFLEAEGLEENNEYIERIAEAIQETIEREIEDAQREEKSRTEQL